MAKPPNNNNGQVIREGTSADVETLVDILCDSFYRDPMLNWVIPPVQLYPPYFRLLIREVYLPRGIIHLDQGRNSAALWLPPEERFQMAPRFSLFKFTLRLFLNNGLTGLNRMQQQDALYRAHLPVEPHFHLQFLGTHRDVQGQGFGSAVLQHGMQMCDQQEMPAYLESSNSQNVPLYEKFGFKVIAEEKIGRSGPAIWFMWREPQQIRIVT